MIFTLWVVYLVKGSQIDKKRPTSILQKDAFHSQFEASERRTLSETQNLMDTLLESILKEHPENSLDTM